MITVLHAPAYCTIQDRGWHNLRRAGMPVSGAMDRWASHAANLMVGNPDDAAVFEWALTGGRLQFDRDVVAAIRGPGVSVTHAVRAGEELVLPRPAVGRFLYLAVAGGLHTAVILGSRSTYLPAGLGHAIKTGDRIPIGSLPTTGATTPADEPRYAAGVVRVVEGPQRHLFTDDAWHQFLRTEWKVSRASDRMGYRLEGEPVAAPAADLPSEAACVGAIQMPPDGLPIVLMADGPTVGGYPKIAVVITADLPILVQRQPGESLRLTATTVVVAQTELRQIRGARG
ncbi:MAG TPA: biotin-dependent carboxyltransferase family protein [Gemmatimonadales bacterium]|nr:biotin-dependent carboxyltransferase family protein [Gemmatimonadales bacterium]